MLAALYLRAKLYRIVARRVKTPVGEIDLIARRFGTTVFIEVKTRGRAETGGEALVAVNQRRIVRAAEYYVARRPHLAATPLRFDVMLMGRKTWAQAQEQFSEEDMRRARQELARELGEAELPEPAAFAAAWEAHSAALVAAP